MSPFLPWSERSKKWEPCALKLRSLDTKQPSDAQIYDPWVLAPLVQLHVMECSYQGLSAEETSYLQSLTKDWSGGVLATPLEDGRRVCMLNPMHPVRRNKVTLMEEISHCFLDHKPTKIIVRAGLGVRDYDKAIEQEAYGVGAAVLIPWRLFYPLLNAGRSIEELSNSFDVTPQLIQYRIKTCGASSLYAARQRRRLTVGSL